MIYTEQYVNGDDGYQAHEYLDAFKELHFRMEALPRLDRWLPHKKEALKIEKGRFWLLNDNPIKIRDQNSPPGLTSLSFRIMDYDKGPLISAVWHL